MASPSQESEGKVGEGERLLIDPPASKIRYVECDTWCGSFACWPKTRWTNGANIRSTVYLNLLFDVSVIAMVAALPSGPEISNAVSIAISVIDMIVTIWALVQLIRDEPTYWLVGTWITTVCLWWALLILSIIDLAIYPKDTKLDELLAANFGVQALLTSFDSYSAWSWKREFDDFHNGKIPHNDAYAASAGTTIVGSPDSINYDDVERKASISSGPAPPPPL
mmetsp:Transcript_6621/g.16142  ORF Transcript_6621/g.16142 Transcript_6621/m.16142 type:complete len:223 (+) Transcript_6621:172-840(+)|eukprot:CAMPEP_0114505162 /NCGR_PEP_ID=MMETSP0109-20121206/10698_1 /TAXON_ID=29199 /ORGANISM="Chlorarachnion reptans, Strain CCCM449" /LENGTH=222 /DNA_ID=CAMNT_0001683567 /DNA_START=63 /DNA_END=731 /DNA_ORIENTATION=-